MNKQELIKILSENFTEETSVIAHRNGTFTAKIDKFGSKEWYLNGMIDNLLGVLSGYGYQINVIDSKDVQHNYDSGLASYWTITFEVACKIETEKENTTETTKTASESNDSMYPAIVTIGGENHGEVKPNPEYSENKLTRDYLAKLFAEFDRLHTKSFQEYKQNWIETHERPHYDYNNFFYGSHLIQRFNGGYKMNKTSQLALFGKYYGKQRFYFRQNSNGYAEFGKMKQVAYGDDYESTILLTFRPEKS